MTSGDGLPPLRDVIARHGIAARKSLGQNFLLDLNLTGRIARTGGDLVGETIVEIGPGPGGLTRSLLSEGASKVIAIERDVRCLAALEEIGAHWPGRLTIIAGDALTIDLDTIAEGPFKIVANLPYNIGTALLVRWQTVAKWPPSWRSATLMFQREVAERIVASPGSKSYGRLAVLAGWRTDARILFDVDPRAFTPAPSVTSSVVQLLPKSEPDRCDPKMLERVTAAAFGQRRKMLRQSLRSLGVDTRSLLQAAGLPETQRAEEIDPSGFVRLTNAYEGLVGS